MLKIEAGAVHEWGFSGVPVTQDIIEFFVQNALGTTAVSNQTTITTGWNTNAFSFGTGAETAGWDKTFSIYMTGVSQPTDPTSYYMGGCVITSLTLSANPNEEGGRWKMDFTVQSRSPFVSNASAGVAIDNAYTSNYVYLGEGTQTNKVMDQEVYLDSVSVTIENPVVFHGTYWDGTDHYPEAYQRAIPGLNISANAVIKYDQNVEQLFGIKRDMTASSTAGLFISNNANIDNATQFGIEIPIALLDDISLDEGDYMKLNCSMKALDNSSADVINIVTGTWA